jgi:hypothetical protein
MRNVKAFLRDTTGDIIGCFTGLLIHEGLEFSTILGDDGKVHLVYAAELL